MLYVEEDVDPDYARQLNQDYSAIASGQIELISSDQVEKELHEMGVPL